MELAGGEETLLDEARWRGRNVIGWSSVLLRMLLIGGSLT